MRVAITLAALLMMLASAPAKAAVDRAVTDETYPAVAGNSSRPAAVLGLQRTDGDRGEVASGCARRSR
jgi:hypothetical protein